jgi:hypothetical protein
VYLQATPDHSVESFLYKRLGISKKRKVFILVGILLFEMLDFFFLLLFSSASALYVKVMPSEWGVP